MELPKVPGRTTPAVGFSYLERLLRDCLRERQFGVKEKQEVVEYFKRWEPEPCCAFCGNRDVRRWDHVVPVMRNGATVLGNMVLACQPCDDSKSQREFDAWMLSDAPQSPKSRGVKNLKRRICRIKSYAEQYDYRPQSVERRLNMGERERLRDVRTQLASLRKQVDCLVADFRKRTGYS